MLHAVSSLVKQKNTFDGFSFLSFFFLMKTNNRRWKIHKIAQNTFHNSVGFFFVLLQRRLKRTTESTYWVACWRPGFWSGCLWWSPPRGAPWWRCTRGPRGSPAWRPGWPTGKRRRSHCRSCPRDSPGIRCPEKARGKKTIKI